MHSITGLLVNNYQSIGLADLPIGKLTVIVGKGNLGKSALLRALCACLFNETGTDFIRQGQTTTEVTLRFGDHEAVSWIKNAKSIKYLYDNPEGDPPVSFNKLAGGVPAELQAIFGIRNIEIDKTFSIRPQIHGQFDAPLLLAESSGKAARALAKLTKLEVVVQAQTAAARDLRRAKQEVTARTREAGELQERIAQFPDIDAVNARLKKAHDFLDTADKKLDMLAQAEYIQERMAIAQKRLSVKPPKISEISGLYERLDLMMNKLSAFQTFQAATVAIGKSLDASASAYVDLDKLETELAIYMDNLGACPLCGQSMQDWHEENH